MRNPKVRWSKRGHNKRKLKSLIRVNHKMIQEELRQLAERMGRQPFA